MTEQQPTGQDEVEVTHEALIRHWPRLREWLDADRTALLLRESVREAAQEWDRHRQDESYLAHRGRRLEEAESLRQHPRLGLNLLELAYLDAATALRQREEREREEQQQRELATQRERAELAEAARREAEQRAIEQAAAARRLRQRLLAAIGLGALALLAAAGAFYGFQQANEQSRRAIAAAGTAAAERGRADDQAATAEADQQAVIARARALAAEAPRQLVSAQRDRSLLLARQAFLFNQAADGSADAATDEALRAALGTARASRELTGHEAAVGAVAFSRDGQTLASAGDDNAIRLWELSATATPIILSANAGPVTTVAFSPDEQSLASGDAGGTVRLWNLNDPIAAPTILAGHGDAITAVAFNPDGTTLVSGGEDGAILLWDMTDPTAAPLPLIEREDGITALAFSADGGRLAVSGSSNGTVLLWNLTDPTAIPTTLDGDGHQVMALAFSAERQRLATGSANGSVRLWEFNQPETSPVVFPGHEQQVTGVAFSPDGLTLALAGRDGSARLWDTSDRGAAPSVLSTGQGAILAVAYSPDGHTLATGIEDGTVRLWVTQAEILADMVCQQVSRNLSLVEWRQFVGENVPYERTCPNLPPAEVVLPLDGESAYTQALPLAMATDDPNVNNDICWFGNLDGFATIVRPACDRAIALAPDDGRYADSRGLARALTGDYLGATADFERFVVWAKSAGLADELIQAREGWIEALRAGRSPFDARTVEELRVEIARSAGAPSSPTAPPPAQS